MGRVSEQFGRIGVLMGGISSERDISLKSGNAILEALIRQGQAAVPLDITGDDETKIDALIREAQIDLAFIALHGRLGEDGTIQRILEKTQVPYAGSGVKASRLAFDKATAQNLFNRNGICTPSFVILTKMDYKDVDAKLALVGSFPVIVKPSCEGSSIGVGIADNKVELLEALEEAWLYGDTVLLEKYIEGREFTVGIIEEKALPVIEICPNTRFFDFKAKYTVGKTDYIVPAKIPEKITRELQKKALEAHRLLGCEDFSRVDFMLDAEGRCYILEVNTIPGFTSTSLLPKAAQKKGMSFDQLCLTIVKLAYGKKKESKNTVLRY